MKIVFRVDASVEIGIGHLMRCLTLARQLKLHGMKCSFICSDAPGNMNAYIRDYGFHVDSIPQKTVESGWLNEAADVLASIQQMSADGCMDMMVIDHYQLDAKFEKAMRVCAKKIMVIDDLANRTHDCDILLDQNYYRDQETRYANLVPIHCNMLLGPSHVLLREEFHACRSTLRKRDGTVRKVLIFFGGSDTTNQTARVLVEMNDARFSDLQFDIVVGQSNPHIEQIKKLCNSNVRFHLHIQTNKMAELIAEADVGIGAGGASIWERCYLGLPTITVVFADNQTKTTEDVATLGALDYLGHVNDLPPQAYAKALADLMENPSKVKAIELAATLVVQADTQSLATILLQ